MSHETKWASRTNDQTIHYRPALLLAAGIFLSTGIAVMAAEATWRVLAGPLVLALALVGADVWRARLRGAAPRPSRVGVILALTLLAAGGILALWAPGQVAVMLPILGASGVVVIVPSPPRGSGCAAPTTTPTDAF